MLWVCGTLARPTLQIRVGDLWGQRASRYRWLIANTINSTGLYQINPKAPFFFFLLQDTALSDEYDNWASVAEIIPIHSKGVVTGRDAFVVDFEEASLLRRMGDFIDPAQSDKKLIVRYDLNPTDWWSVAQARRRKPRQYLLDKTWSLNSARRGTR